MAESKEAYLVHATTLPELLMTLNFQLARIADRLDNLEGHRDRPRFYKNPQLRAATASRQVRTDSDQIVESQERTSAPTSISTSNDLTGSDSVDITALNLIINTLAQQVNLSFTTLQNAQIVSGSADEEPPADYDVTFQGQQAVLGGEDTTW